MMDLFPRSPIKSVLYFQKCTYAYDFVLKYTYGSRSISPEIFFMVVYAFPSPAKHSVNNFVRNSGKLRQRETHE